MDDDVLQEAEVQVRYEGYLVKQEELVAKFKLLEDVKLPEDIDYTTVSGLTREVVEKADLDPARDPRPGQPHFGDHPRRHFLPGDSPEKTGTIVTFQRNCAIDREHPTVY